MAHFDRSYGIEIECFLPEGTTREDLAAAITSRLGGLGTCNAEHYNHVTSRNWKIVTDGSLGDYARGIEIVSPVLSGAASLATVEVVCRALNDFGCSVNKKCGLHVHVGVGAAPLHFWKNIVSMYSVFEGVIDRMMPASRRGSANAYCRTMTGANINNIAVSESFDRIYSLFGRGRYSKVNMASYLRHNTVEFRQHSGTTDANKVTKWTVMCLKMVDTAMGARFNPFDYAVAPQNRARMGTKNYQVGSMLLRPEGVTPQEAMAATGWTSISMPEMARICGIEYTTQKTGRITRYFARQSASEVSVDAFATLIQMTAEEKSYMESRINDLSSHIAWAA